MPGRLELVQEGGLFGAKLPKKLAKSWHGKPSETLSRVDRRE